MSKITTDRQFKEFDISSDFKVTVKFNEILTIPAEEKDGESKTKVREYSVRCDDVPHNDLIDLMKKLKPHAFDIIEMDQPEPKKKQDYQISTIQVSGDVLMKKSRVQFWMAKKVNRTNKDVSIGPTGQVVMYGNSNYAEAEKMSQLVEKFIDEVWLYLGGKYDIEADEDGEQLPLFSPLQLENV